MSSLLPQTRVAPSSQDELSAASKRLSAFADVTTAAADDVKQKEKDMVGRLQEAAADYYQECDKIIEALSQVHKEMHELLARDKARREKADAERLEELETTAKHLEAAIAAADARLSDQLSVASLRSAIRMLKAMRKANTDVVSHGSTVAVKAQHLDTVSAFGRVVSEQVDPTVSFMKGQTTFAPGVPVKLDIYPRFVNGEPATYVRRTDITLDFQNVDDDSLVKPADISYKVLDAPFRWRVRYTFHSDERAKTIRLVVRIHGIVIGEPWIVVHPGFDIQPGVNPRHVRTYDMISRAHATYHGLVVDPSERWMAVSSDHTVTYYELPSCAVIRVVGKRGSRPGEFSFPGRMCLCGPKQNRILVCDVGNHRVQELDKHGAYVRELRSVTYPWGIAYNNSKNLIAVSRRQESASNAAVVLLEYTSGTVTRIIGTFHSVPGLCQGVRFTPSGDCVLVVCWGDMLMLALDGTLVKQQRVKTELGGYNDVDFTVDGNVVMANCGNHCIDVHAGDSLAFQSSFSIDQKYHPTAFAVAGRHLYVLDWKDSRVRVFE